MKTSLHRPASLVASVAGTLLLCIGTCEAKRAAPAKVEPVTYGIYTISAPNDPAQPGKISILNTRTKQVEHALIAYQIVFLPDLERDVQWVFITSLKQDGGTLLITDEKKKTYKLDIQKHLDGCKGCK